MKQIKPDKDIKPLSEFRAKLGKLVEQVQSSKRPLVLTKRGRSAAVVLDVGEYEQMLEELEMLRDVHKSLSQVEAGEGVEHEDVKKQVLSDL